MSDGISRHSAAWQACSACMFLYFSYSNFKFRFIKLIEYSINLPLVTVMPQAPVVTAVCVRSTCQLESGGCYWKTRVWYTCERECGRVKIEMKLLKLKRHLWLFHSKRQGSCFGSENHILFPLLRFFLCSIYP